jgi:hypothetical protein
MNLRKALALAAYALASWIFIYILSTNDYEWMIGEKDADGSVMTICSLPLRNDDYSDIAPLMMIVFVSIGLFMGVRHMRRLTNFIPNLAVGSGLVLFTAYRFYGRTLLC